MAATILRKVEVVLIGQLDRTVDHRHGGRMLAPRVFGRALGGTVSLASRGKLTTLLVLLYSRSMRPGLGSHSGRPGLRRVRRGR